MQDKRLLIIDDDQELTDLLREYLAPQGYAIDIASDGELGLQHATGDTHYDLILLDVMLPKLDGFEVLKKLRTLRLTPVLMLTAKGEDFDKILGLELGADDYLPKPFNHRELSARIKALIRRMTHLPMHAIQQPLQVADVVVTPLNRSVTCQEKPIDLTSTEYAILQLLMSSHGSLVSKQEISKKVLGRVLEQYDRSIDMHVSNIRKKLNQVIEAERIKTIRGAGYIFLGQTS